MYIHTPRDYRKEIYSYRKYYEIGFTRAKYKSIGAQINQLEFCVILIAELVWLISYSSSMTERIKIATLSQRQVS